MRRARVQVLRRDHFGLTVANDHRVATDGQRASAPASTSANLGICSGTSWTSGSREEACAVGGDGQTDGTLGELGGAAGGFVRRLRLQGERPFSLAPSPGAVGWNAQLGHAREEDGPDMAHINRSVAIIRPRQRTQTACAFRPFDPAAGVSADPLCPSSGGGRPDQFNG